MMAVKQYRVMLHSKGESDVDAKVKDYAAKRTAWKRNLSTFNPFTNDPNCKNCGKKKETTE